LECSAFKPQAKKSPRPSRKTNNTSDQLSSDIT
jgi:hypothetical protein